MRQYAAYICVLFICCITTTLCADEKTMTPQQAVALNGGPTLVSISVKGAPPQQFYKQLWNQMGFPPYHEEVLRNNGPWHLEYYPNLVTEYFARNNRPLVTMNYQNAPFWKVVRRFENQTKLALQVDMTPSSQTSGISGMPYWNGTSLCTISDAIREQRSEIQIGKHSIENSLNVYINFFSDPKVIVDQYDSTIYVDTAVTNAGQDLIDNKDHRLKKRREPLPSGWFIFSNLIPFRVEQLKGTKIAMLKGYLIAPFVAGITTWKEANIKSRDVSLKTTSTLHTDMHKSHSVAELYEINNFRKGQDGCLADVHLRIPKPPLKNSSSYDLFLVNLKLFDGQGERLLFKKNGKFKVKNIGSNLVDLTNTITIIPRKHMKPNSPIRMTWKIPTQFATIKVPFEFTDIPIPQI